MKKRTLLLGLALSFAMMSANAQIIYTDIQPDGLPANGGFDFNNDNTNEFDLSTMEYSGDYFDYTNSPAGTNLWANGDANNGWDVIKPLDSNTSIGSNGNFIGYGDGSMVDFSSGNVLFPLNQDAYIGVKIVLNSQIHYGWIRVQWNGSSFIYKDFAYESSPETPILAGAVPTNDTNDGNEPNSIHNLVNNKLISVFPIPSTGDITIANHSGLPINAAVVVDLTGRSIKTFQFSGKEMQQIDMSNFSKGIYFVKLLNNQTPVAIKKIILN